MAETGARPWLDRRDVGPIAALSVLALAVSAGTAIGAARSAGVPLGWLAAFFDGSIYLEIAKSFPLPYAPGGPDYPSHAPGYPGFVYLLSLVAPVHWGFRALLASWLSAALAAVAFYAACRALGPRAFWPSALFVLANPRWLSVAATAHAESTAMLFAVAALAASLRHRLGLSMAWLGLAAVTRYPALLLGVPLAWAPLCVRRDWRPATFAWLALPLGIFALLHVYLWLRIPGFSGLSDTHQAFWQTGFTWPFAEFVQKTRAWAAGAVVPNFGFAIGWLVFYLASIGVGLWRERGEGLALPIWIATLVLVHASLSGYWTVLDFPRLVVLSWPAAVLIWWRWLGAAAPVFAVPLLCGVLGVFSVVWATRTVADAVVWQQRTAPFPAQAIRRLGHDTPQWIDFRSFQAESQRR